MEIIEYPKALYRAGDYMAVADADNEAAARADGWNDWQADQDAMKATAKATAKTRTTKD